MQNRHISTLAAAAALLALTACEPTEDSADAKPTPATTTPSAGIPPEPTGAKRTALLAALTAINPGIDKDQDKAIDAARNQCSAINNGADKLNQSASQRFSYGGNKVSEAEGKLLNEALKKSGFCKT